MTACSQSSAGRAGATRALAASLTLGLACSVFSARAHAQQAAAEALPEESSVAAEPASANAAQDIAHDESGAQMAEEELSTIELRFWQLRHESRERLLAPLALVVTGYGTALVGVAAAFTTYAFAEQIRHRDPGDPWKERLDVNNDGSIDGGDERAFRRMARSFAAISAVGGVIGVVGSVFLAKGLREQPNYAREMRGLKQRRRQLRRELEYGASAQPGAFALSLRGRFF